MFDNTLLKTLDKLVKKEKLAKHFSRRLRVKGILIAKSETKKGNLRITVCKGENESRLIIPKTHKERFALASKLPLGSKVAVEGIKSKVMFLFISNKVYKQLCISSEDGLLQRYI